MSVHRNRLRLAVFALAMATMAGAGISPVPAGAMSRAGATTLSIVRLRDEVSAEATRSDQLARLRIHPRYVYSNAIQGYAAPLTPRQEQALRHDPRVAAIERNRRVHAEGLSWGLDRIDQSALPVDGQYKAKGNGANVDIYVIDTGVRRSHQQLRSRVAPGVDLVDGGAPDDCNGHGTHVAGIAAGSSRGVAPGARVTPVRVLGCDGGGSIAGVIAGVDWVAANHRTGLPAVANMSLGGATSRALDEAVTRAISTGVTFVVAAGNGNAAGIGQDACSNSPARVPSALTVGATSPTDRPARFSNHGRCVDLWAPGVDIPSSWADGDSSERVLSGTSMAAPFVAGAAALVLEHQPTASPAQVDTALKNAARRPDRLLQVQDL